MVSCPSCGQKLRVPARSAEAKGKPAGAATARGGTAATGSGPAEGAKKPEAPPEKTYLTQCFGCTEAVPVPELPPPFMPICDKCKKKLTARGLKKPFVVRISGEALRWPSFCACCCNRADSLQRVSHTLQIGEGDKAIEKRAWDVPYCKRCVEHVTLHDQANESIASAEENLKKANERQERFEEKEVTYSTRPIWIGGFWGGFLFLLGTIAFNPLMLPLMFPDMEETALTTTWVGISFLFFFLGALLGLLLWYLVRQKELKEFEGRGERVQEKVETAEKELRRTHATARETRQKVRSLMFPTCCQPGITVQYLGWEKDIHSFSFESESFTVGYLAMNDKNMVEPKLPQNKGKPA